ncbi:MAG TPA: S1/P1 nuclease [Steroidobacteraceae bacterium]|nr:S1/P1 nuclease [Steroidobacteraceae bacterium]
MKTLLRALLLLLLGCLPVPVLAWAQLGHRLVGELAASRLTPAAKAQVAKLLAGEPDPTLGGVADWADKLRDTDPQRFKATSAWHYIESKDGGCGFVLERDCPDGNCVVAAIDAQRRVLADLRQTPAARRDALKFLVHLVADAHQPLHADNHPDAGGNQFAISLRTDLAPETPARGKYAHGVMDTNLHAVWDYYILASARLGAREYAARLLPKLPALKAGRIGTPLAWARESCALIDARRIYPPKHSLDHAYLTAMRPLAERRIETAAVRLAAVLNQALGGS